MIRSRLLFWAFLLFCLSSFCLFPGVRAFAAPPEDETPPASAKDANRAIAVADFDGADKELGRFLAETLLTNLAQSDKLHLVERAEIRQALAELKLQSTGLVEPQQVKKLGKLVSADHLVVGSYLVRDGVMTINARLLDVKTGRLEPGGAATVSGSRSDLSGLTTQLAQKFHRRVTGEDLLADGDPLLPQTPRARVTHTVVSEPAGDVLALMQRRGLIPADVRPEDAALESELAALVGRVARALAAPNDYTLATAQPALPVTRIRVLAALVKLVETPQRIAAFRADASRPCPPDGDATPIWGQPYIAAALSEGWWRTGERFKPRSAANWTFVAALLARLPLDDPAEIPVVRTASTPDEDGFTGLVVDAGDFDLQRAMSPRILDEQGQVVYPDPKRLPDLDFVENHGIVGYCNALEGAKRAGAHPLVVSALEVRGTLNCDLVVSNATARKIRAADRKGQFFTRWSVCFLSSGR